jgi:hypothetical protein
LKPPRNHFLFLLLCWFLGRMQLSFENLHTVQRFSQFHTNCFLQSVCCLSFFRHCDSYSRILCLVETSQSHGIFVHSSACC